MKCSLCKEIKTHLTKVKAGRLLCNDCLDGGGDGHGSGSTASISKNTVAATGDKTESELRIKFEPGSANSNICDINQCDGDDKINLLDDRSTDREDQDKNVDDNDNEKPNNPKSQIYECKLCDDVVTYSNITEYRSHLRDNHPESRTVRCNLCWDKFRGETAYREHIQAKHDGFEKECKLCLELFSGGIRKDHKCAGQTIFSCNLCVRSYCKKESLWKHLDDHNIPHEQKLVSFKEWKSKELLLSCIHCENDILYKKYQYKKHLKDFHNGRAYRCTYCIKSFKDGYGRSKHMQKCEAGPTEGHIKCSECPKSFDTRQRLNYHVKIVHQEPRYSCDYCPKKFHHKTSFERHVQEHRNERKFRCNLCALAYNTNLGLARHNRRYHNSGDEKWDSKSAEKITVNSRARRKMEIQEEEVDYSKSSADCVDRNDEIGIQKECTTEDPIDREREENNKLRKCNDCNFSTISYRKYKTHLRTNHPETITFRCHICDDRFEGETLYQKHIHDKHEGFERKCTTCLELYSGAKQDHNKLCNGRIVLSCLLCDLSFVKKSTLWKHLDDHNISDQQKATSFIERRTDETFFSCDHCGDDTLYMENPYWKHRKDFHSDRRTNCKSTLMKKVARKRSVPCKVCSVVFANARKYDEHIKNKVCVSA